MNIEDIDQNNIRHLEEIELRNLRSRFINIYERHFSRSATQKATVLYQGYHMDIDRDVFIMKYIILRQEMSRREMKLFKETPLDLEIYNRIFKRSLWELDVPTLGDIVAVNEYISISGSFIKSPKEANDVDIVIREDEKNRDESLEVKIGRAIKSQTEKEPHFVYSPRGPHSSYIPVFDLVLRAREDTKKVKVKETVANKTLFAKKEVEEKVSLSLGHAFTPLKSRGGYGKYEFGDIEALWTTWAQGYIPEPGIAIETKIDGFRIQVHKKGDDIRMLSEDAKKDLAKKLPELGEEVQAIKTDCILDGELTIYLDDKKVERKDMPTYVMAEKPPAFKAKIDVFDCLWFGEEDLHNEPWTYRQEYLNKIFSSIDELLLHRIKPTIVKSEAEFRTAIKTHSGEPHSEGAMCKVINSKYPLDGQTSEWAKYKNLKELRVKVTAKEQKEGGGFIYTCALKDGIPIGRSYATKIEAGIGDVLEIAVAEVKYDEEKNVFTWDNPIVRSKKPAGTALTTKEQAIAISRLKRTIKAQGKEFGNITFDVGDEGNGVAQIHMMGLDDDEIDALKHEQQRVIVARLDIAKLEATLKSIAGDHGAHIDIRLRKGQENSWQGNEIFIGNISGLSKLDELFEGKRKLRAPWKQSRAEEPETETIRGPLGWMEAGSKKIDTFPPGSAGATANEWGAMIRIDTFKWEMYLADEHAKKIRITDGKHFNGNWLFAYVPITEAGKKGERIWMISKLPDDDHEKEQTEKALGEGRGIGGERQGIGGTDICICPKCGHEEKHERNVPCAEIKCPECGTSMVGKEEKLDVKQFRATGVDEDIKDPKKRYRELIADLRYLGNSGYPKIKAGEDWGEWKLEDILKYFAKIVDTLRSIYFPVLPPKIGDKSFNTSYWQCYRDARRHMKSKPPSEDEAKEWDKKRKLEKSTMFKVLKIDKAQQIVGGVVYEPDEIDTQGDYTDEKEIEKAKNLFMEKYATDTRRIRINHKGKKYFFPILECFQPEVDTIKGGQRLVKGAWWLSIHITNKDIWTQVEDETLTGFSMGGRAKA